MALLENTENALLFFSASFVAGAINAVAGGGTFLTFPVFIMGGLTALQANIMSTIALWPGVFGSMLGYKTELGAALKGGKMRLCPLLVIGFIGGLAGALTLLVTPETVFSALVPWLLLGATLIFTFGGRFHFPRLGERRLVFVFMAAIAFYGGYFGAGIGILMLALLQVMGLSQIHRMNALKVLIAAVINAATMMVFVFSGKVIWPLAFVMIAGSVAGGYLGARAALKVSPAQVRLFVSFIGFSMTAYFFVRGV